ncbi:nucleotidyltransferase [Pseudochryseolinea flava]|uniref:Nucleotidyltransferase family protein n=1 Tax=Pseudochryseolinea flava TaxID=2059302 RepID=A0A364XYQ3_9BACT|nr:nucleotidyltransferase [Pseudochryseolinea flava]RAV98725.1 hypothetical protein DQQ10_22170 [Pseudochryseolinea flava]
MEIMTEEKKAEARGFYHESLDLLNESGIPYMLGGGFAQAFYTGIQRDTKDLDIFCKASDYPKILKFFADKGYKTELTDVRWLAKIFKDDHFIDIIFDTVNNICRVDDTWLDNAPDDELEGRKVKYIPAVELLWCKIYVQNRERFDGADVNHLLLKQGKNLDWKRLLSRMDQHWHLLLAHILVFQFVYPSEYHQIIPTWIFEELMSRAHDQYALPPPVERVCRGPIIDQTQYMVDIKEWDYKVTTIKTV